MKGEKEIGKVNTVKNARGLECCGSIKTYVAIR